MNANNSCPCCSDKMLRHLSNSHSYWYCRSCRIEMPNIESKKVASNKNRMKFLAKSITPTVNVSKNIKTIASF